MIYRYFRYLFFIAMISTYCSCNDTREKLLVSGCGWKQVAILDKKTGEIEWSHPLAAHEDCNDVEITKEGNILYAYTSGARLIDREQQTLWDFKVKKGEELFTATQLPSGRYMLAICGMPSRIIELDPHGQPVEEIEFDTNITGVHDQFRQIVKTPQNTYLIPLMGKGEVIEMNKEKEVINRVECGGNPFTIQILKNGNWLVSCGDAHYFVEIDPGNKQILRKVGSDDLSNISLLFVAELVRYKNGNTLISNWNGHSQDKSQPLLIEVDPGNRVVWTLPLHPDIVNISAVYSFKE
ncbi:beta-propeller domain-containing protein [Parabacteroides faecis]|uniref:beta-propeller domain-containing protein n=1 Tax=Parabacteroides faecis TaxID=1217282 RepID=UPI003522DABE